MATPLLVPLGELGTDPFGAASSGKNKPANVPAPVVQVQTPTLDPLRYPDEWTYVTASGQRSPGVVPIDGVEGFEREDAWDVKGGKGTTGATTTRTGQVPAKGAFTFHLWKVEHFAAWDRWLALFKFDASKKTGQAVPVYHPALASVQPPITAVVMTKHTPVKPNADGRAVVKIELLEYFPAKSTGASTAKGAKGYMQAKEKDGGEDPAIKKMQQQVAQLAKQLQGTN